MPVILTASLTRLPARCYKRVLCAEVCSPIEGLDADAEVVRRGQIGTPLYFDMPAGGSVFGACSELRWRPYSWRMESSSGRLTCRSKSYVATPEYLGGFRWAPGTPILRLRDTDLRRL